MAQVLLQNIPLGFHEAKVVQLDGDSGHKCDVVRRVLQLGV